MNDIRKSKAIALVLLVVLVVAAFSGCSNPSKPNGTVTSLSIPNGKGAAAASKDPRSAAESFLKSLCTGDVKSASARLDIAFKKYIAPPFFSDDQTIGYSESDVQKVLVKLAAGSSSASIQFEAYGGGPVSFRGELQGASEQRIFSVRLARQNDNWLVTHFQTARQIAKQITAKSEASDTGWPKACAQDFLDLLAGGPDDHDLTLRLLSEGFKKQLPAPSIAESGLGYARKDVRNWLNAQRGECTGYSLTAADRDGAGFRFSGELTGAKNRPFALTLAPLQGDWLVERFEVK